MAILNTLQTHWNKTQYYRTSTYANKLITKYKRLPDLVRNVISLQAQKVSNKTNSKISILHALYILITIVDTESGVNIDSRDVQGGGSGLIGIMNSTGEDVLSRILGKNDPDYKQYHNAWLIWRAESTFEDGVCVAWTTLRAKIANELMFQMKQKYTNDILKDLYRTYDVYFKKFVFQKYLFADDMRNETMKSISIATNSNYKSHLFRTIICLYAMTEGGPGSVTMTKNAGFPTVNGPNNRHFSKWDIYTTAISKMIGLINIRQI